MSRQGWNLIKQSKQFYFLTYRATGTMLLVSLIVNLCLTVGIYYFNFNHPEHAFYATNGVTYPDRLIPMDQRNYSSTALLAPDPVNENTNNKVIPQ